MCYVVQHAYKSYHHHHHWELVIPCYEGFDGTQNRCNVANHQFVSTRYLPQRQGLCFVTCVKNKQKWLKQALKAATMDRSRPVSDAELDWRFLT